KHLASPLHEVAALPNDSTECPLADTDRKPRHGFRNRQQLDFLHATILPTNISSSDSLTQLQGQVTMPASLRPVFTSIPFVAIYLFCVFASSMALEANASAFSIATGKRSSLNGLPLSHESTKEIAPISSCVIRTRFISFLYFSVSCIFTPFTEKPRRPGRRCLECRPPLLDSGPASLCTQTAGLNGGRET